MYCVQTNFTLLPKILWRILLGNNYLNTFPRSRSQQWESATFRSNDSVNAFQHTRLATIQDIKGIRQEDVIQASDDDWQTWITEFIQGSSNSRSAEDFIL
jgi:hypothetical protein